MISDAISMALLEAADDPDVKAVVFRVNSPGGSVTASDQIWAAVKRVRDAGKPVVVSMGELAASGGYYVSAGADAIVALPSTITGSIGIFSGKVVVNEALNRNLGANAAEITVGGPFANAYSGVTPFSNSQRTTLQAQMDAGYADFTTKVAQGRKLPIERVREIAQGRVWTGAQARQLGLVDEVGGLRTAIAKARTLAKIDPKEKIQLRHFPGEQTPFEAISSLFGASAQAARAAAGLSVLMGDDHVRALVSELRQAREPAGMRAEEPFRVH
jgi:protease-4